MIKLGNAGSRLFADRVHVFDIIDSTSTWLIKQAPEQPTLCIAYEQTHGRGRRQKEWQAPHGNIALSCSFPAEVIGSFDEGFSLVVALSVLIALKGFVQDVRVKWPNDLLINDKKCAGILIQIESWHNRKYMVVGIGVNSRHAPLEQSTSIYEQTNKEIDNRQLTKAIINSLAEFISLYREKGFQYFRPLWLLHDGWYGKQVKIIIEPKTIIGEHLGIDESGKIIVGDENQSNAYTSGDVSLRQNNVS